MNNHVHVSESKETRLDILKRFALYDFEKKNKPYKSIYLLHGKSPKVLEKYNYPEYTKNIDKSEDIFVFKILDFVCDNFGHDGSSGMPPKRRIKDIINFAEKNNKKINCRGLSILLASLLRLHGIKARHITCMPYEDPFKDCHVVVDCLMPSGKRIIN